MDRAKEGNMEITDSRTWKGILLLEEMLRLIKDYTHEEKELFEEQASDACQIIHQHLLDQAAIPDNQIIYDYLDSHGKTVKKRLDRQAKDLEEVASGKMLGMVALGNIRIDISHSDGLKQLLVCGGPFTDEINDTAKMAGFALKLTSGSAYEDPEESSWYDVGDGFTFLKHVAAAIGHPTLEWSGSPPKM